MTWRWGVRIAAILLNGLFALWLFATAAVWGPNDFVGGIALTIPPLLAIIAICLKR